MSHQRMGVVVIGQSPRPSIAAEIAAVIPHETEIILRGALDGMSRAEIGAIAPESAADTLFTLLPDGAGVTISKAEVERRAERQIAKFVDEGMGVTLLSCTGKFPGLSVGGLVVLPSAVLHNTVAAVMPKGRLGVFSPLPEQTALIGEKWNDPALDVVGVSLRPGSDDATVDVAAREMSALRPELVVMDCMGYTRANKVRIRQTWRGPMILAIAMAARVVAELTA